MDEQSTSHRGTTLQWPDYVVIGVMLSISTSIGIYYRFTGGRQRTTEEYFSADRSMGAIPLALGLSVSFMSACSMLGMSAETYALGTSIMLMQVGVMFSLLISIYFYLPVFAELKTATVYEYLDRRFSSRVRMMASTAFFMQLLLYAGVVLFAPSLALEATTGLSGDMSVLLVGIVCTMYSTMGGIKAVLITDVFQGILMYVGIGCVIVVGALELEGGLSNVWSIAQEGGRIDFFDFRFDPTVRHSVWSLTIGSATIFLSVFAVNQVQVQRMLSAKTINTARAAVLLSGPVMVGLSLSTCYAGLVLFAVYKDCDPVTAGKITSYDKIMPYFVADRMSQMPGVTGLFIIGVFSATLSTISAILNSLSIVALEDYLKPACRVLKVRFPEEKASLLGKFFAIFIGTTCVGVAYLAKSVGNLVEAALALPGAITGPILGLFTLGMFVESANETGAIVGVMVGLVTCLYGIFGQPRPKITRLPMNVDGCDNSTLLHIMERQNATASIAAHKDDGSTPFYLQRISYLWNNLMGITIVLTVGYLVSLVAARVIHKDTRELDPALFTPIVANRIRRRRRIAEKTTSSQVFVLDVTK